MKISEKINASTLALTACIIASSAAGFYGLGKESEILSFVTGPGWQAADGAMESTIGLQRQMLELNKAVTDATAHADFADDLEQVNEAATFTEEALNAMRGSGLMPTTDMRKLETELREFERLKNTLIHSIQALAQGKADVSAVSQHLSEFHFQADGMLELLEGMEEVGDSQVESQITKVDETKSSVGWLLSLTTLIALGIAAASMMFSLRHIVQPIRDARDHLRRIAEIDGDLTVELPVKNHDEISELAGYFNAFVSKIRQTIGEIERTANDVHASAMEMQDKTTTSSKTVHGQNAEIEQVATAVNEMSATVEEVARSAAAAATAAQEADSQLANSSGNIARTKELIHRLDTENHRNAEVISTLRNETDSIGSVLDVIRGIAEQTNLLALNAAIEAARAGEQGRGFAVVADEVRTLATRTQQSTEDIHAMIARLQTGAASAVQAINNTQQITNESVEQSTHAAQSLGTATSMISRISEMNFQISTATDEQSAVSHEINRNINNISHAAERVAETLGGNAKASETLAQSARHLKELVGQFKTRR